MAGIDQIDYRNAGGGTVQWTRHRDRTDPGGWYCFGCRARGEGGQSDANEHARDCHAR